MPSGDMIYVCGKHKHNDTRPCPVCSASKEAVYGAAMRWQDAERDPTVQHDMMLIAVDRHAWLPFLRVIEQAWTERER